MKVFLSPCEVWSSLRHNKCPVAVKRGFLTVTNTLTFRPMLLCVKVSAVQKCVGLWCVKSKHTSISLSVSAGNSSLLSCVNVTLSSPAYSQACCLSYYYCWVSALGLSTSQASRGPRVCVQIAILTDIQMGQNMGKQGDGRKRRGREISWINP